MKVNKYKIIKKKINMNRTKHIKINNYNNE